MAEKPLARISPVRPDLVPEASEYGQGLPLYRHSLTFRQLIEAGDAGVPLNNLGGSQWLHMPPSPVACALEVAVNGKLPRLYFNTATSKLAYSPSNLLTPGGTLRIPVAEYVTVRLAPWARGAYGRTFTVPTVRDHSTTGMLHSDLPVIGPDTAFAVLASREWMPQAVLTPPEGMEVGVLWDGTTLGESENVAAGETWRVAAPGQFLPQDVVRRYKEGTLRIGFALTDPVNPFLHDGTEIFEVAMTGGTERFWGVSAANSAVPGIGGAPFGQVVWERGLDVAELFPYFSPHAVNPMLTLTPAVDVGAGVLSALIRLGTRRSGVKVRTFSASAGYTVLQLFAATVERASRLLVRFDARTLAADTSCQVCTRNGNLRNDYTMTADTTVDHVIVAGTDLTLPVDVDPDDGEGTRVWLTNVPANVYVRTSGLVDR